MDLKHYELSADLFRYPDRSFYKNVAELLTLLKEKYPSAGQALQIFFDHIIDKELKCMEELYTRSFEIQAITTLDVGYVLFGDDYKRGEILSNLAREHETAQNDCGIQLADHLPNLLCLMARSKDGGFIKDLVEEILSPALKSMIDEFEPQRIAQKNELYKKHYKTLIETSTSDAFVYQHALKALFFVLKQDFEIQEDSLKRYAPDNFLSSLNTEMSVEKVAGQ
ncbi:MAG: hypothetical protein KGJ11_00130 [Candidatus Omnitrophica bacterium]|nr:hypothetical protein [Candidatus Omnitrophota bacterium]